jgi:two-component system sensor kinase FixL
MSESPVGPRELTIQTTPAGSKALEVAVLDTGPGLSSESRERLFMPFFTTKATGMGLGLALSKSIIEAHGGNLWATANPDRGVTFHFTLPYELRKKPR